MANATLLSEFRVVSEDGADALHTRVEHISDTNGYELIVITQESTSGDGTYDVVVLHREQLIAAANQLKGH